MGDYRFSFKASFSMGGVEDKCDMWLNYSQGDDTIIDRTVEEWLKQMFERGIRDIDEKLYEADVEARERERREAEDAILKQADEIRARRVKQE